MYINFSFNSFDSECSLSHGFIIELEWDQELESRSKHLWFMVSRIQDAMSNDYQQARVNT